MIDIHADDYGLTLNTSKDILNGVNEGKLTSISIMPNMSCFEKAKELFYDNIDESRMLNISVHLNFLEGYCVADKDKLGFLVDDKGLFSISWVDLVKYNYNFFVRKKVKTQLKLEIKMQLYKVIDEYSLLDEGKKLRIDSHQHSHMIPIVMEALLEVIKEEKFQIEYIRISKEPWMVYLKESRYISTYRFINIVKVFILNWYARKDECLLKKCQITKMYLCGVFLSGKMDAERVQTLLPKWKKYACRKGRKLEVLFHPGSALLEEVGEEFNHPEANKFYLSQNRQVEYEAMMQLSNVDCVIEKG